MLSHSLKAIMGYAALAIALKCCMNLRADVRTPVGVCAHLLRLAYQAGPPVQAR